MKEILIVGGGAAGIAAALSAAQSDARAHVTVLEGLDRVGKKILATGNGRCNLSNRSILPEHYFTARPDLLCPLLENMPTAATEDFFRRQGLLCCADEAGRLYPYGRQAAMVLDVLRLALERSGVEIVCGCKVTGIVPSKHGFTVQTEEHGKFYGDAVILTTGGKAAPSQGVTGVGYALAKSVGHSCTALYPALVALKCRHSALKGLKGIRVQCAAALLRGGKEIARQSGEVQLTDYGLSGIPIMQLSCALGQLKNKENMEISLDFFPEWEQSALEALLLDRVKERGAETIETLFLGLLQKRLLYALMKDAGLSPLSRTGKTLSTREVQNLCAVLKDWRVPVEGPLSWEHAQVTGGGVALDEIDGHFASRCQKGLYLAGEVLDVTGTCGGYNLHWAWCSGMEAGRACVQEAEA